MSLSFVLPAPGSADPLAKLVPEKELAKMIKAGSVEKVSSNPPTYRHRAVTPVADEPVKEEEVDIFDITKEEKPDQTYKTREMRANRPSRRR
jgi:hypothetical protein